MQCRNRLVRFWNYITNQRKTQFFALLEIIYRKHQNLEDMERIFEPFYTKKAMDRSGTGLGMVLVWGTIYDNGSGD